MLSKKKSLAIGALFAGAFASACQVSRHVSEDVDCSARPSALFEERILPLLKEEHPNTCAQCHAGGIDLASFLRPDPCESMACMRERGLVNLDDPEASVILTFIERAEPESELVTTEVIDLERSAFLSWIRHEAHCQGCASISCPEPPPPACDLSDDSGILTIETDTGGCERETMERLFRGTIFNWRNRCSPCHFQEEEAAPARAPRFFSRTGSCQVASLNTLQNVERSGYIDIAQPEKSLLVRKPLDVAEGGVPHEGHAKFQRSDRAYEDFIHFLERYAECQPR